MAEPEPMRHTTMESLVRHRLSEAVGGWRGAVDSGLPTVAFVVVWSVRQDLRGALVAAALVLGALALVRLVERSTLRYVLGACGVLALAALLSLRSGRAEDAFLPGILMSCAYLVLIGISLATRWPAVGFIVGLSDPRAKEDPLAWRKDPALVAVCRRLTWPLLALYVVRVGIMLPLYLAGQVAALGVAKLVLGWPAWLVTLAVMAVLLGRGHTPIPAAGPQERPAEV